jgi:hypothetical protein
VPAGAEPHVARAMSWLVGKAVARVDRARRVVNDCIFDGGGGVGVVVEIEVEEKTKLKLMIRQEGSLEVFVGC